ncbi:MAG TPA: hypothetical protein VNI02_24135 [Blastocatellia bacterium]|jgi:hypothetical protein|nr:hypothetical protein [Blastocatellia bacterium]
MAATSKRIKKNAGTSKKQAQARSLRDEPNNEETPSPISDEVFTRYIYALVSFQQLASWYYSNGTNGTSESRAIEITKDIIRLEHKYLKKGIQGLAAGRCPSGWIDCGGLCMEPGSVCS